MAFLKDQVPLLRKLTRDSRSQNPRETDSQKVRKTYMQNSTKFKSESRVNKLLKKREGRNSLRQNHMTISFQFHPRSRRTKTASAKTQRIS